MKKRIISLLMAALMLVALAVPAAAAEKNYDEILEHISGDYYLGFIRSPVLNMKMNGVSYLPYNFTMTIDGDQFEIKAWKYYFTGAFDSYRSEDRVITTADGARTQCEVKLDENYNVKSFRLQDDITYHGYDFEIDWTDIYHIKDHPLWDKSHSDNSDGTYIFSDETLHHSGSSGNDIKSVLPTKNGVEADAESVEVVIDGPFISISYMVQGEPADLNGVFVRSSGENASFLAITGQFISDGEINKNGVFESLILQRMDKPWDSDGQRWILGVRFHDGADLYETGVGTPLQYAVLKKVEEPEPQEYNVNIMGFGSSDTNEYMVNILGNIQGTFIEGENTLTDEDVQAQNLSINTFNLTNGATRPMDIGTIERIIVTVADGVVTNVEIKGSAQTNPGNFDRYTLNCNVF